MRREPQTGTMTRRHALHTHRILDNPKIRNQRVHIPSMIPWPYRASQGDRCLSPCPASRMSTRSTAPLEAACETTDIPLESAMTTCTHKVSDPTILYAHIWEVDFHAPEGVSEAACILHSTIHCSEDKAAKEATILLHHQVRGTIPSVQAERRATIVVEWVPGSLVEEALGDRQILSVALEETISFDSNKTTHSIDLNAWHDATFGPIVLRWTLGDLRRGRFGCFDRTNLRCVISKLSG